MIQGFETREITDKPIRAFVKSAGGIVHVKKKTVGRYDQTEWPTYNHLEENPIAVFGILRGTGELIKQCDAINHTYYHFDHAYYFKEQKHGINKIFGERIYRITKNGLMLNTIDELDDDDKERLEKFKKHIVIEDWKTNGDYILVLPPSEHVTRWYGNYQWEHNTIKTLKTNTKRPIKIRTKQSKTSFEEDLKNAWAVVTCQSTACVDAIVKGVPSFCDSYSMGAPVSMTNFSKIEQPYYPINREEWLDSLLANQYLMSEIENGFAWNRLKKWSK